MTSRFDKDMSSICNEKMYSLAREEGEVAFIKAVSSSIYEPIDIAQASDDDDKKRHFDVKMLEYDNLLKTYAWHYIDVKDVEEKNFSTGNYVLRNSFIDFHRELKPYGYYIAFRLVEGGKRTSKFILAGTQEVLSRCRIIDKERFKLVSLAEVKEKCSFRLVEEECIEETMEKYK